MATREAVHKCLVCFPRYVYLQLSVKPNDTRWVAVVLGIEHVNTKSKIMIIIMDLIYIAPFWQEPRVCVVDCVQVHA